VAVEKGLNTCSFSPLQSAILNMIINTSLCFSSLNALLGTSCVNGQTWHRTFNRSHAIVVGV
jgi:hypothetical protein